VSKLRGRVRPVSCLNLLSAVICSREASPFRCNYRHSVGHSFASCVVCNWVPSAKYWKFGNICSCCISALFV